MWLHYVAGVACYLTPCIALLTCPEINAATPSILGYASLNQQETGSIYPAMGGNRLLYARGKLDRGRWPAAMVVRTSASPEGDAARQSKENPCQSCGGLPKAEWLSALKRRCSCSLGGHIWIGLG